MIPRATQTFFLFWFFNFFLLVRDLCLYRRFILFFWSANHIVKIHSTTWARLEFWIRLKRIQTLLECHANSQVIDKNNKYLEYSVCSSYNNNNKCMYLTFDLRIYVENGVCSKCVDYYYYYYYRALLYCRLLPAVITIYRNQNDYFTTHTNAVILNTIRSVVYVFLSKVDNSIILLIVAVFSDFFFCYFSFNLSLCVTFNWNDTF